MATKQTIDVTISIPGYPQIRQNCDPKTPRAELIRQFTDTVLPQLVAGQPSPGYDPSLLREALDELIIQLSRKRFPIQGGELTYKEVTLPYRCYLIVSVI